MIIPFASRLTSRKAVRFSRTKGPRVLLDALRNVAALMAVVCSLDCNAALVRFDFTGTIISTFGVENAGTSVSGFYTFDPSVSNFSGSPHVGNYIQLAPAEFHLQTDGGFSFTQTTTFMQIQDRFQNGIVDGYRVDADTGTFSGATLFDRLELSLSNNSNPFINEIAIPTAPPDFSRFEFHRVGFFGFDGFTPTKRVLADVTSLTVVSVPEPPAGLALAVLIAPFTLVRIWLIRRSRKTP